MPDNKRYWEISIPKESFNKFAIMYIITGSSGSYEEYSCWNICAVHSEERAKELVEKLNKLQEYNSTFGVNFRKEFNEKYSAKFLPSLKKESQEWIEKNYDPPSELEEVVKIINRPDFTIMHYCNKVEYSIEVIDIFE